MKKFNPYSEPYKPKPPQEEFDKYVEMKRVNFYNYSTIEIPQVPGATHICVEADSVYDGTEVELVYFRYEKVKTPNYGKLYKRYENDLVKYKEEKKEWDAQKKQYDEEQKTKTEEHEKRLYQKLKKKFG